MPDRRPPTIVDIAAATGLSKSVVSRALNDEPGVSAASRALVEKAAAESGYVANAMAQRMRSQRADTMGVLVRDPASPYYGALLGALQSEATRRGLRLVIMSGSGSKDLAEERDALQSLLAYRVDGLLVCSGELPAADLYPFADRVPTVVVGRSERDERIGSVCCDDVDGARQLVDHLVDDRECAQMVVPVPEAGEAPTLHDRAQFFVARARERGLEPSVVPVADPDDLDAVLAAASDGGAVLAPNDRWAVRALERLPARSQVLVTGYDGIGVYASPLLGLVTVVQPIAEIAAAALAMVSERATTRARETSHRQIPGVLQVPTR